MNDLMTKSFTNYVELKKQALKDMDAESWRDLEAGGLTRVEEENLSQFFEEIEVIQSEMDGISGLLVDLQFLNEETKSAHSAKILQGLRDRMDSDMVAILRNAKIIKARLEVLDRSNIANRTLSRCFAEGNPVDRTRISVTNGIRTKLREMMNGFQSLREQIVSDHRESLKRRYFNATGEAATEEVIENMLSGENQVELLDKRGELNLEVMERNKAVNDIKRSLTQLHQMFLDMAVIVEVQEEKLNDIEENVTRARDYICGGTDRLISANALKRRKRNCTLRICVLVLIVLLVCLIPTLDAWFA